jgi:hypothetical protein
MSFHRRLVDIKEHLEKTWLQPHGWHVSLDVQYPPFIDILGWHPCKDGHVYRVIVGDDLGDCPECYVPPRITRVRQYLSCAVNAVGRYESLKNAVAGSGAKLHVEGYELYTNPQVPLADVVSASKDVGDCGLETGGILIVPEGEINPEFFPRQIGAIAETEQMRKARKSTRRLHPVGV